jgi:hypothetical protein
MVRDPEKAARFPDMMVAKCVNPKQKKRPCAYPYAGPLLAYARQVVGI